MISAELVATFLAFINRRLAHVRAGEDNGPRWWTVEVGAHGGLYLVTRADRSEVEAAAHVYLQSTFPHLGRYPPPVDSADVDALLSAAGELSIKQANETRHSGEE